jgi:hypothetical protein
MIYEIDTEFQSSKYFIAEIADFHEYEDELTDRGESNFDKIIRSEEFCHYSYSQTSGYLLMKTHKPKRAL